MSALNIIYEDSWLIVINKPSGLHSVDQKKSTENTLASLLKKHYKDISKASPRPEDGGLVQRLDKETSGLILAARNSQVWQNLFKMLSEGKIKKSYLALVEGKAQKVKIVEAAIGSPYRSAQKVRVYKNSTFKEKRILPAKSKFILQNYYKSQNVSLIEAFAPTARRHQIRAHCAFEKMPLVGDSLYGSKRKLSEIFPDNDSLPKFFLHAWRISFIHPESNKEMSFEAKIPYEL